ncbi:MAG: SPFH domain-containing protein [Spirochaetes bacterium]|nr:SPFH domain-containing protein [Spirochaetota bacterium]
MDPVITALFAIAVIVFFIIIPSIRTIGPDEVGLVIKRFSFKKLKGDSPIAFRGEAGYQADLLMPGLRIKFWILYSVEKHPWVQVNAGKIGVVVSQVGKSLPTGAKSGVYKNEFGNFSDLEAFVANGGEKGVQRPVLPPGTLAPIHPVGFLVITENRVYGVPVGDNLVSTESELNPQSFGLRPEQLRVVKIEPKPKDSESIERIDTIGIVTTYEGDPLPSGDIASRLGGYSDIESLEKNSDVSDYKLIEVIIGSKNSIHNNYQDFQAFLDNGGKIGIQHDPVLYGAYNLNPFLISIELVPMLVVEQGQVAVIKSYVGLVTQDTSGEDFLFGSLVRPGHRGIWQEPLRTGKYAINPHCYNAEIVPTSILTLNWAEAVSYAHDLDQHLKPIVAKSREGFEFSIDLQVQIHVADTQAPWVISMVKTMKNMVQDVLQAAVGNHFRDKLQSIPAIKFIETRQLVQREALEHIQMQLKQYKIETPGVYIQDVVLPPELVKVLTDREIANQEIHTFKMQEESEKQRIDMEKAKGTADMQQQLAKSQVNVEINTNNSKARKAEADGEAEYIERTGTAQGAKVKSIGMARANAYEAQVNALGSVSTTMINIANSLSEGQNKFVPEILISGGGSNGALDGLAGIISKYFLQLTNESKLPEDQGSADKKEKKKSHDIESKNTGK